MLSEFAKKVQQYFEKDPSIYIEKIKEEYKGTIAEWQTKYFNLLPKWQINETEVKKLREENDKLKKERDLYKTSETNLGTKLAKFVGSASKEAITRSDHIFRLGEAISKEQNYVWNIRKGANKLEEECKKLQGSLKTWTPNQIRNWLTKIYPLFNQADLPENYALMEEGFSSWIKLLEEKKTLLASQKVADLTELGDKIQRLGTEKDKNWNNLIQEQNKNKQLEIQITNKDNDIKNKEEKIIEGYINWKGYASHLERRDIKEWEKVIKELDYPEREYDWTQLNSKYEGIRQKLILWAKAEKERMECQNQITSLTQAQSILQTKYDMEVRSKEELLTFLNFYRQSSIILYYNYSQTILKEIKKNTLQKLVDDWMKATWSGTKKLFIMATRSQTFEEKEVLDLSPNYSNDIVLDVAKRENETKDKKPDFPFLIKLSESNKKFFSNKLNALWENVNWSYNPFSFDKEFPAELIV